VAGTSFLLTDGAKTLCCSKIDIKISEKKKCYFLFSLSLITGEIPNVNDRLIGGKGGTIRFKSPALELYGVRGLVR
jgi:hypothetical protein